MDEGNVVSVFGQMRQQGRQQLAAFSGGRERPGRFHQVAVLALKRDFCASARQRRAIVFFQRRFVIPQINMRCRAGTKDLQDLFALGA